MGDLSAEPSMEEILSSIKRIIAEEGDGGNAGAARLRRGASRLPADGVDDDAGEDVLELDQRLETAHAAFARARVIDETSAEPAPSAEPPVAAAPPPERAEAAPRADAGPAIASSATIAASRGALDALTRMVVKPEPGSDGTLEGMVRELLRPMLSAWLDQHLPRLVEELVAREIARITAAERR